MIIVNETEVEDEYREIENVTFMCGVEKSRSNFFWYPSKQCTLTKWDLQCVTGTNLLRSLLIQKPFFSLFLLPFAIYFFYTIFHFRPKHFYLFSCPHHSQLSIFRKSFNKVESFVFLFSDVLIADAAATAAAIFIVVVVATHNTQFHISNAKASLTLFLMSYEIYLLNRNTLPLTSVKLFERSSCKSRLKYTLTERARGRERE